MFQMQQIIRTETATILRLQYALLYHKHITLCFTPPHRRIFEHVQILPAMLSYPGLKSPRQNWWLGENRRESTGTSVYHCPSSAHSEQGEQQAERACERDSLPKCPQSVRYTHPDTCSAWRYCSRVCVKVLNRPMVRSLAHCSSR